MFFDLKLTKKLGLSKPKKTEKELLGLHGKRSSLGFSSLIKVYVFWFETFQNVERIKETKESVKELSTSIIL